MSHPRTRDEDLPSTGFLPLSLALTLFITGLFVLGIVPGAGCEAPKPGIVR